MSIRDGVLSSIFGVLIAVSISAIIYVTISSPAAERFTEFFILGPEGQAEGYPRALVVGEEGRVVLGIVNHEHKEMSYHLLVRIGEEENGQIGPILLGHEKKWEQLVTFTPNKAGRNQKVEFLLFAGREGEPYDSLLLLIDVEEER